MPPHEFNLDFPHLMLRYRAIENRHDPVWRQANHQTDRNGKIASKVSGLTNWAGKCGNAVTRPVMESVVGVHRDAKLPEFTSIPFAEREDTPTVNKDAPAYGRKAVIYATCFANYNNPHIGESARAILAKNGVETEVVYPRCCGMPQLEQGDIGAVAESAQKTAADLLPWIEKRLRRNRLGAILCIDVEIRMAIDRSRRRERQKLSAATSDITEYIVSIAKNEGMAEGITALDGGVTVHISCHSRAQNMGQKAAEMLRLIPEIDVNIIERCSGHGGSWGVMKENFEVALKVGKPVARKAADAKSKYVLSECPLARDHILQGIERLDKPIDDIDTMQHQIELMARAYVHNAALDLRTKTMIKTEITRDDIISMEEYGASRAERRKHMTAVKRDRRMAWWSRCHVLLRKLRDHVASSARDVVHRKGW